MFVLIDHEDNTVKIWLIVLAITTQQFVHFTPMDVDNIIIPLGIFLIFFYSVKKYFT